MQKSKIIKFGYCDKIKSKFANKCSIKIQELLWTEFLEMLYVGFALPAKTVSNEVPHLWTLEEAFGWAHPDLSDDSELKEVAGLLNRPSVSLSNTVNKVPLNAKSVGRKAMLSHFR